MFVMVVPFLLGDAEIFLEADSLVSPVHIVPEWYFLFAYAILRSIPNKFFGVVALVMRVVVFYFFLFLYQKFYFFGSFYYVLLFLFVGVFVVLTWIGQCSVEHPFIFLGASFTFYYFILLLVLLGFVLFVELLFLFFQKRVFVDFGGL